MYIKTQSELEDVCRRSHEMGCIGIDLEFIPENTYYPRLALVQLAVESDNYIVDPLGSLDLSPLDLVVQNDDIIKIVHAGSQDMGIFFHRTGIPPRRVFDTQIAAGFLGLGHQISYASLVFQLLGVTIKKGQSYTNWLKRPLSPQQVTYALEDVAFLLEAYEKLILRLEDFGRASWVGEELVQYEQRDFYERSLLNPIKRVKKSNQLHGKEYLILDALANWREAEAQRRDLPRKKILPDNVLIDLAKRKPNSDTDFFSMRSFGNSMKRYMKSLIDVIASSRELPFVAEERVVGISLTEEQKLLIEFISFCLKAYCMKAQVAVAYVATKSEIELLVRDFVSDSFIPINHRVLQGWRKEAVGSDLLDCLLGKSVVGVDPKTGNLLFRLT